MILKLWLIVFINIIRLIKNMFHLNIYHMEKPQPFSLSQQKKSIFLTKIIIS